MGCWNQSNELERGSTRGQQLEEFHQQKKDWNLDLKEWSRTHTTKIRLKPLITSLNSVTAATYPVFAHKGQGSS